MIEGRAETHLSDILVQETLTNFVSMGVPINTTNLAEGMECLHR